MNTLNGWLASKYWLLLWRKRLSPTFESCLGNMRHRPNFQSHRHGHGRGCDGNLTATQTKLFQFAGPINSIKSHFKLQQAAVNDAILTQIAHAEQAVIRRCRAALIGTKGDGLVTDFQTNCFAENCERRMNCRDARNSQFARPEGVGSAGKNNLSAV